MVPPRGLTFVEYKSNQDGPLVNCRYETASYSPGSGGCALCGKIGCSHPLLMGKVLSHEQWQALPARWEIEGNVYDKRGIFHR